MSLFSYSPRGRNNPPGGARAAATMPADPTSAVLDPAHVGDIVGALGTIDRRDTGQGASRWQRLRMLLVIMGPGLIVMVGDNDAGGVATYSQAGQNYGMALPWQCPDVPFPPAELIHDDDGSGPLLPSGG